VARWMEEIFGGRKRGRTRHRVHAHDGAYTTISIVAALSGHSNDRIVWQHYIALACHSGGCLPHAIIDAMHY
jgi:hypothetical protein